MDDATFKLLALKESLSQLGIHTEISPTVTNQLLAPYYHITVYSECYEVQFKFDPVETFDNKDDVIMYILTKGGNI